MYAKTNDKLKKPCTTNNRIVTKCYKTKSKCFKCIFYNLKKNDQLINEKHTKPCFDSSKDCNKFDVELDIYSYENTYPEQICWIPVKGWQTLTVSQTWTY